MTLSISRSSASFGGSMQHQGFVRGRFAAPAMLTPKQRAVLASLVDGKVTLCGRTLTRPELMAIFNGHQLPRDPKLCEALDIRI